MGKKVKFTGSNMLGSELRRLRGARTLDDIVKLSQSAGLTARVKPIAAPTLSQIENGISMPALDTMNTLAAVYQVPAQQLLGYVTEQALCREACTLPDDDALEHRFGELLARGAAHEALPLAIHGERKAKDERERVAWRANRASCLRKLGLRQEAIWLMLDCMESRALSATQRTLLKVNLVKAFIASGHLQAARDLMDGVIRDGAKSLTGDSLAGLSDLRADLLIACARAEGGDDAPRLREAILELSRARTSCADPRRLLTFDVREAQAHFLLGNTALALTTLERTVANARELGEAYPEMAARIVLGKIHHSRNRASAAAREYERAESLALQLELVDELFSVYVQMLKLAHEAGDRKRAALLTRKCQRYYPRLSGRSIEVREYEALTGSGS